MNEAAFWFAVGAAITATANFALSLFRSRKDDEIAFLKTQIAALTRECAEIRREYEEMRDRFRHCEANCEELRKETLELMRRLVAQQDGGSH